MIRTALMLTFAALALGGCGGDEIVAPDDRGVCYAVARMEGEPVRFNPLARDVPNIELCAKELELMRRRFIRLGSGNGDVDGAYQGNFLFLRREGIFMSQSADGQRYLLLVRAGNQLVAPGAVRIE